MKDSDGGTGAGPNTANLYAPEGLELLRTEIGELVRKLADDLNSDWENNDSLTLYVFGAVDAIASLVSGRMPVFRQEDAALLRDSARLSVRDYGETAVSTALENLAARVAAAPVSLTDPRAGGQER